MKRSLRTRYGFTLVEVLVVMAIITLLAAVIFASVNEARKKARDDDRIADMQQIAAALQVWATANGRYPSSTDGTCSGTASFGNSGCLQVLITAGLFTALPQDLTNSDSQVYNYDNTCISPSGSSNQQYRVWTIGEREHNATTLGWTDSKTIGATSCTDPQ